MRLLLVEDEIEARDALARALTRSKYEVTVASSVAEALPKIDVDLAVVDIKLGKDDRGGLAILEAIRAKSRIPVVIVTAFADVEKVKAALNLGASHLLEKPFRATDLGAILERLQANERAQPDAASSVREAFARARLTAREQEVAMLALKGLSSPEIAQVLAMSDKTVRQHLSRVYEKHGVSSRGELVSVLFPI